MEIAAEAAELGRPMEIDMEGTAYTDVTLDIFEAVRRRYDDVCLAIQAYLYRSEKDIERLAPLQPKLRLVKGAYREPPALAIQKKSDVDAAYRRLLERLLDGRFFPAVATHDPAMQEYAKQLIRERKIPPEKYEFQMIYGVRRDLQVQVREQGHPLRVYVPFGTEWCPYFMRRLAERPANCWFVVRSLIAEGLKLDCALFGDRDGIQQLPFAVVFLTNGGSCCRTSPAGEAAAGSAGEQPAKEYPAGNSFR